MSDCIHNCYHSKLRSIKGRPPIRSQNMPQNPANGNGNLLCSLWQWFFVGFILFIDSKYYQSTTRETVSETAPKNVCDFSNLKTIYPNQDLTFWVTLKVGVNSVLKKNHPNTFLLVYEEDKLPEKIVENIVNITQNCLDNRKKTLFLNYLDFSITEFLDDYGYAILKYKQPLNDSGVMVVEYLNKIPAYVSQCFHSFCDHDNPLVNRAVIFLTMPINKLSGIDYDIGKINYLTHKTLKTLWSDLKDNILHPLITRVTENILFVKPE